MIRCVLPAFGVARGVRRVTALAAVTLARLGHRAPTRSAGEANVSGVAFRRNVLWRLTFAAALLAALAPLPALAYRAPDTAWRELAGISRAPLQPSPAGIALDADGNLYVADYGLDRILKFTADGLPLGQWGSSGAGSGQLSGPFGITLDDRGNLFVSEQLNNRIQKFTADGTSLMVFGAAGASSRGLRTPFSSAFAQGRLYLADFGNDRVQVLAPDGTWVRTIGSRGTARGQFLRPTAVLVDAGGGVFVSDYFNNRVQRFLPEGRGVTIIGSGGHSDGTESAANPFAALGSTSEPGALGGQVGLPGPNAADLTLSRPEGLAWDREGNLLVVDQGHNRVVRYSPDGQPLGTFGHEGSGDGEFNRPKGISVDSQSGHIFVSDTGNGRIERFSADGTFELSWPIS